VVSGASWRMRTQAVVTAWWLTAFQYGTDKLPDLEELIRDKDLPTEPEDLRAEYHKRLREFGLE